MATVDIAEPERRPTRVTAWASDGRVRRLATVAAVAAWFHLVVQLLWEPPLGVVAQGVVVGGLTAMISFGISLIYRSNRIINFAAGDMGAAPAALAVLLIVGWNIPYALALPAGLAAGAVLGGVIQFLFIRRFRTAPRLILTVFTIGLSLLLAAVQLWLPSLWDIRTPPQDFPSPFSRLRFTIDPITFTGNDIIAVMAVPALIVFLAWFFRYTNIGIAVRASAEDADRASLVGVNVGRIQMIVWVVATVMASLALFLRAGIVGLPLGTTLGPYVLLRALTAAVIGRMERLPTIFAAAVGLGVIEQAILFDTGKATLIDPILFLIVIGALLFQRRGAVARVLDVDPSTWKSVGDVRPVPRQLSTLPEVRWLHRGGQVALLAVMLGLGLWLPESRISLVGVVIIYAIIGLSLVVLTGWAGQVSLGQMAFVGIGAATGGWLTSVKGLDLSLALVGAGVVGAIVATLIGVPALRIRGLFLAVATLAFALCTSSYLLNGRFMGWLPSGRIPRDPLFGRIDISTEQRFYYVVLLGLLLALGMVRGLRRSRTGRVLIAVRENERVALSFGVNATAAKLTAFAASGFLAAFAGALFVHHQQSLLTMPFVPAQSLRVFLMVVIGGLGSVPGVIAGAVFLHGTQYFIHSAWIQFLTSGIGVCVVLLFLPGGLGSLIYGVRDAYLRWVAGRHGLIVPSLIADVRNEPQPPPAAASRRRRDRPLRAGRPADAIDIDEGANDAFVAYEVVAGSRP